MFLFINPYSYNVSYALKFIVTGGGTELLIKNYGTYIK